MLYLVAIPIGNYDDITLRAIKVLRTCHSIAAEDTRRAGRLLTHLGISASLHALHEHNEQRMTAKLLPRLESGDNIAIISDAGTPCISDPGFRLVTAAIAAAVPVTAIPGASALLPALQLSGLATHAFLFRGFPPRKTGKLRSFLHNDRTSDATLIYYESPYRLATLVREALAAFGNRPAAIARELTKTHEEVIRAPLHELNARTAQGSRLLGECVLLIAGAGRR